MPQRNPHLIRRERISVDRAFARLELLRQLPDADAALMLQRQQDGKEAVNGVHDVTLDSAV